MERRALRCIKQSDRIVAYGLTEVVFSLERPLDCRPAKPGNGVHVAFHAGHRDTVDACYRAGLNNGGTDDRAPGVRASTTRIRTRHLRVIRTGRRARLRRAPHSRASWRWRPGL